MSYWQWIVHEYQRGLRLHKSGTQTFRPISCNASHDFAAKASLQTHFSTTHFVILRSLLTAADLRPRQPYLISLPPISSRSRSRLLQNTFMNNSSFLRRKCMWAFRNCDWLQMKPFPCSILWSNAPSRESCDCLSHACRCFATHHCVYPYSSDSRPRLSHVVASQLGAGGVNCV